MRKRGREEGRVYNLREDGGGGERGEREIVHFV